MGRKVNIRKIVQNAVKNARRERRGDKDEFDFEGQVGHLFLKDGTEVSNAKIIEEEDDGVFVYQDLDKQVLITENWDNFSRFKVQLSQVTPEGDEKKDEEPKKAQ